MKIEKELRITAPYATYEEALNALKEQVEELLPENFEYEKRFVEFFGISFG